MSLHKVFQVVLDDRVDFFLTDTSMCTQTQCIAAMSVCLLSVHLLAGCLLSVCLSVCLLSVCLLSVCRPLWILVLSVYLLLEATELGGLQTEPVRHNSLRVA